MIGFSCKECGRQWSSRQSQTPEQDIDVCPECYDEDKHGEKSLEEKLRNLTYNFIKH